MLLLKQFYLLILLSLALMRKIFLNLRMTISPPEALVDVLIHVDASSDKHRFTSL